MTTLSDKTIDELTEEFEAGWTTAACGPKSIRTFLSSRSDIPASNLELLTSLIQVDIERRWLSWSFFVGRNAEHLTSEEILAKRAELPPLNQYAELFQQPSQFESALPDLATLECRARNHWGDAIGPLYYKENYDVSVAISDSATVRMVTCIYDESAQQAKQSWPLRGTCTFGRRRSSDPKWNIAIAVPEGNRYLIADKSDASISRQQLQIQLLTQTHLLMINTSQVSNVTVGGKTMLPPNASKIIAFPFSVRLPGRSLIFD